MATSSPPTHPLPPLKKTPTKQQQKNNKPHKNQIHETNTHTKKTPNKNQKKKTREQNEQKQHEANNNRSKNKQQELYCWQWESERGLERICRISKPMRVNQSSKYVAQPQQQRPITLTWNAVEYKVHKLHQRHRSDTMLRFIPS